MSSNSKLNTPIKIVVLSNPGTANDLRAGKTLIDSSGNLVSGTMTDINEILNRTISNYHNSNISILETYAFCDCTSLTSVNTPACITIGSSAFEGCTGLTSISFPACTSIGGNAFYSCSSLTSVDLPVCAIIGGNAFMYCTSLTSVSFPACTTINNYAFGLCTNLVSVNLPVCTAMLNNITFSGCINLMSLTLGASTVCTLGNTTAFTNTPMSNSTYTGTFGSIYVPASLVDAYKSATNWATYSSRITSIE